MNLVSVSYLILFYGLRFITPHPSFARQNPPSPQGEGYGIRPFLVAVRQHIEFRRNISSAKHISSFAKPKHIENSVGTYILFCQPNKKETNLIVSQLKNLHFSFCIINLLCRPLVFLKQILAILL